MIDESSIWGNTLLPAILDAIGIEGDVKGVQLHFEYDKFATVTIMQEGREDLTRTLTLFGTNVISGAIGAPKGLQAVTIDIEKDVFVICHCRYVPLDMTIDGMVAALTQRSAEKEVALEQIERLERVAVHNEEMEAMARAFEAAQNQLIESSLAADEQRRMMGKNG